MKKFFSVISLSAIMLMGCATTPRGRVIQFVMASDAMADQLADGWAAYVDGKITACRAKLGEFSTMETRRICMGVAANGDKMEAAIIALIAAQSAVRVATNCKVDDENPFIEKCIAGQVTNWLDLMADVMEAANALKPFFAAMKGLK